MKTNTIRASIKAITKDAVLLVIKNIFESIQ